MYDNYYKYCHNHTPCTNHKVIFAVFRSVIWLLTPCCKLLGFMRFYEVRTQGAELFITYLLFCYGTLQYGDSADNTVENSSVFSVIQMH